MSKLFNKWDLDEVEVQDLGLKRYICLTALFLTVFTDQWLKQQDHFL